MHAVPNQQSALMQRVGELTATTDLGRFLIDALRSGGI